MLSILLHFSGLGKGHHYHLPRRYNNSYPFVFWVRYLLGIFCKKLTKLWFLQSFTKLRGFLDKVQDRWLPCQPHISPLTSRDISKFSAILTSEPSKADTHFTNRTSQEIRPAYVWGRHAPYGGTALRRNFCTLTFELSPETLTSI